MRPSVFKLSTALMLLCILHSSTAKNRPCSDDPSNNWYTFHNVQGTWEEAREACREMGAHLATIETVEEWKKVMEFIEKQLKKDSSIDHWFIGLRKESGTWRWTESGSPGVVVATDDSRWHSREPSSNPMENCGEISAYNQKNRGKFNNVYCSLDLDTSKGHAPRGYICENY